MKASRSFHRIWKERDSAQPRLLEAILYKDNFNRAYKRVKANKGAPGIDGMTIEEALPYLKEHQQELTDRIYRGKYTPSPVRRVEIPLTRGAHCPLLSILIVSTAGNNPQKSVFINVVDESVYIINSSAPRFSVTKRFRFLCQPM